MTGEERTEAAEGAAVDPDEGRLHRRRARRAWDDGLMRLPIPLGNGRRAFVLCPGDGLSVEEAQRVAAVVREWRMVSDEEASDDA